MRARDNIDRCFIALILFALIALPLLLIHEHDLSHACSKRGGVYVSKIGKCMSKEFFK